MRMCCPWIDTRLTRMHARDLTLNHGHKLVLDQHVMRIFLWMAGFEPDKIAKTARAPEDGHWKVIGAEKDDLETCRMEAQK